MIKNISMIIFPQRTCPDCGKPMLEVNGKKGKMLVCQDRECGHRKNVSRSQMHVVHNVRKN